MCVLIEIKRLEIFGTEWCFWTTSIFTALTTSFSVQKERLFEFWKHLQIGLLQQMDQILNLKQHNCNSQRFCNSYFGFSGFKKKKYESSILSSNVYKFMQLVQTRLNNLLKLMQSIFTFSRVPSLNTGIPWLAGPLLL